MTMPVFERTPAPPALCAACGCMEVTIDASTRLCVPCWRVVVLAPWANWQDPYLKTRGPARPRDPAGHG